MSGFLPERIVNAPPVAELHDDECIAGPDGVCVRTDERHLFETVEVCTLGQEAPIYVRGVCHHRHPHPVKSVTGEVVARLCTACDAQLPA